MVSFLRIIVWIFAAVIGRRRRAWQPGSPIECLVVGFGGISNAGAEARTAGAVRQMLDADPRVRVTLTSMDRLRSLRYLEENERLHVAQLHHVFVWSVARLAARADIVVLVEGSCFKEIFSPALLWFFLFVAELAQRAGVPTVAYAVDAGMLTPRNARWARDVAQRMDLLTVRTESAAQILRTMGVTREIVVTTDTAFSLVSEARVWAKTVLAGSGIDFKKPIMGIVFEEFFWWPVVPRIWRALLGIKKDRYRSIYYHSWPGNAREQSSAMKDALASYADWAATELGAQVVFFAMQGIDVAPCREVVERMAAPSVLFDAEHASAAQLETLLRELDWLVTCRYDALVFSMGGAVPPIGLAHDERIASIMDELGMLNDYLISHEEERLLIHLKEKTSLLRSSSDRIRRRIESAMPRYLARMDENKVRFAQLIATQFIEEKPQDRNQPSS